MITRRRLAVLGTGGGISLFLAACGVDPDPNAGKSDTVLLGYIRELQLSVKDGYGGSSSVDLPDDVRSAFETQATEILRELDKAIGELTSDPPQANLTSGLDVGSVYDYEDFLIGTANAVVPDLDTEELRELAYRTASAAAGRKALANLRTGENPAPDAFVLGETLPALEMDS